MWGLTFRQPVSLGLEQRRWVLRLYRQGREGRKRQLHQEEMVDEETETTKNAKD